MVTKSSVSMVLRNNSMLLRSPWRIPVPKILSFVNPLRIMWFSDAPLSEITMKILLAMNNGLTRLLPLMLILIVMREKEIPQSQIHFFSDILSIKKLHLYPSDISVVSCQRTSEGWHLYLISIHFSRVSLRHSRVLSELVMDIVRTLCVKIQVVEVKSVISQLHVL